MNVVFFMHVLNAQNKTRNKELSYLFCYDLDFPNDRKHVPAVDVFIQQVDMTGAVIGPYQPYYKRKW